MLKNINLFLGKFLNVIICFTISFMAVLVFFNVILRYFFHSGIPWSEEIVRFLFVWMVFFGAIAAFKDKMHISVDVLINLLPRSLQRLTRILVNIVVMLLLGLILHGSWKVTMLNVGSLAPATQIPYPLVYGVGIISSITMGGIVLANIYKEIENKKFQD
ncbi:MAG: TRAP transporter small permease [Dehalobacterium sp.]